MRGEGERGGERGNHYLQPTTVTADKPAKDASHLRLSCPHFLLKPVEVGPWPSGSR